MITTLKYFKSEDTTTINEPQSAANGGGTDTENKPAILPEEEEDGMGDCGSRRNDGGRDGERRD